LPSDPLSFAKVSSSEEHLTVTWQQPALNGGCAVTGYLIQMEDIDMPGYLTVYEGVQQSTQTQVTLTYPNVQPSRYYRLKLQSKNCGYFSAGT